MPARTSSPAFWMVKQEPDSYPWSQFVSDGRAAWTGVRNFLARNNLREMQKGDLVFYYHSVTGKEVVGVGRVITTHYPDPTATEGDWSAVDLAPLKALKQPVSLAVIKADEVFRDFALVRQSRLSVLKVTPGEAGHLLRLGQTKL